MYTGLGCDILSTRSSFILTAACGFYTPLFLLRVNLQVAHSLSKLNHEITKANCNQLIVQMNLSKSSEADTPLNEKTVSRSLLRLLWTLRGCVLWQERTIPTLHSQPAPARESCHFQTISKGQILPHIKHKSMQGRLFSYSDFKPGMAQKRFCPAFPL